MLGEIAPEILFSTAIMSKKHESVRGTVLIRKCNRDDEDG